MTCRVEQCEEPVALKVHQLCNAHYIQWRTGKPFTPHRKTRSATVRDDQGRKRCSGCKQWIDLSMFAVQKKSADGLQPLCRTCRSDYYRQKAEHIRDRNREQRFGLTRVEFDAMLASQGGRCAVCRTDDPGHSFWHVDHDHACCPKAGESCGKCIRGILCARCNAALGLADDNAQRLRDLAAYLDAAASTRSAA